MRKMRPSQLNVIFDGVSSNLPCQGGKGDGGEVVPGHLAIFLPHGKGGALVFSGAVWSSALQAGDRGKLFVHCRQNLIEIDVTGRLEEPVSAILS